MERSFRLKPKGCGYFEKAYKVKIPKMHVQTILFFLFSVDVKKTCENEHKRNNYIQFCDQICTCLGLERGGEGWCLVIEDRTLNLYLLDLLNDRKYTADFKWGVWKCTRVHIL